MRVARRPLTMWGLTMWLALLALGWLIWKPRLHEQAPALSLTLHAIVALPFATLAGLFLVNDTSVLHVAAFGGEALPLKYRFAATWAAREGPLLMWLGWMALLAWWWRRPLDGERNEQSASHVWRLRCMHLMSLTLLLVAFSLEPFKATPAFFVGAGLNPLLQTDLMVIHPPLIFLTYSFCLHLTAIAISSAYTNGVEGLGERMVRVARPGLLVATLGIGLGGLWAYLILDWGGYWAWDPVETGSFLPWLALVMLVHLRTRPGHVRSEVWVGAGLAAGLFALFATTVTRAGGVWASSVHTFVTSDSGTPPSDVFGRLMVLRDNIAATEVMTYVVWMLTLLGCWLAVQRASSTRQPLTLNAAWGVSLPVWTALLGCLLFTGSNGEGLGWDVVPAALFVAVPLLRATARRPKVYEPSASSAGRSACADAQGLGSVGRVQELLDGLVEATNSIVRVHALAGDQEHWGHPPFPVPEQMFPGSGQSLLHGQAVEVELVGLELLVTSPALLAAHTRCHSARRAAMQATCTMSSALQPRERSMKGRSKPWTSGPRAVKPARRWASL